MLYSLVLVGGLSRDMNVNKEIHRNLVTVKHCHKLTHCLITLWTRRRYYHVIMTCRGYYGAVYFWGGLLFSLVIRIALGKEE